MISSAHFIFSLSFQASLQTGMTKALTSYDRALAVQPDHADVLNNRGNTLRELNRHDEALASYDRAISLRPDYADAFYNRGNALQDLRRFDEALASYDCALAVRPDYVDALYNRGVALQQLDRNDDALAGHDRALSLRPGLCRRAHYNRGIVLQELKRHEEARGAAMTARWSVQPDRADGALQPQQCPARIETLRRSAGQLRPRTCHAAGLCRGAQ